MRRTALVLLLLVGPAAAEARSRPAAKLPTERVRDGDSVFHTSRSAQSKAVQLATGSVYSHMGVVLFEDGRPLVLEAVQPVSLTPLADWVARGDGGRVVVKRLREADAQLGPEALARMRSLAAELLGRPYDLQFRWDDERLYCSELVYKLFERAAGVRIGRLQEAGELELAHPAVRKKLRQRFGAGAGAGGKAFDPDETVITPRAMFEDTQLVTVFAN